MRSPQSPVAVSHTSHVTSFFPLASAPSDIASTLHTADIQSLCSRYPHPLCPFAVVDMIHNSLPRLVFPPGLCSYTACAHGIFPFHPPFFTFYSQNFACFYAPCTGESMSALTILPPLPLALLVGLCPTYLTFARSLPLTLCLDRNFTHHPTPLLFYLPFLVSIPSSYH